MVTEQLRKIVIEAAEKMLLEPEYEFSEEEEIAISLVLIEQFERQEQLSADIGQITLHEPGH